MPVHTVDSTVLVGVEVAVMVAEVVGVVTSQVAKPRGFSWNAATIALAWPAMSSHSSALLDSKKDAALHSNAVSVGVAAAGPANSLTAAKNAATVSAHVSAASTPSK